MINNISFIVIARNEAFAVDKCLHAIFSMPLRNCEVIAVDSDSSDRTLAVMKRYLNQHSIMKIFQCKGYINAAVARNIGLNKAQKKYICFCDGDTEWNADFIQQAIKLMNSQEAIAVAGQLKEHIYSPDYNKIIKTQTRFPYPRKKNIYYCGGNFIVLKNYAHQAGSWDEGLVRNEDIDYTLRLSRIGPVIGLPMIMGIHHTQSPEERTMLFQKQGVAKYHGAVLRKNIDRPKILFDLLISKNPGFIPGYILYFALLLSLTISFFNLRVAAFLFASILGMISLDLILGLSKGSSLQHRFLTHYCYPFFILIGLIKKSHRAKRITDVIQIT